MNETKLEILRDMGMNNNGYGERTGTVMRVSDKLGRGKFPMSLVRREFEELVEYGHLRELGKSGPRAFFCLPENYDAVMSMFRDLTLAKAP